MKHKFLFLFVFVLALALILGFAPSAQPWRTSLMAAVGIDNTNTTDLGKSLDKPSADSGNLMASVTNVINADKTQAANGLTKLSADSERLGASLMAAVRDDDTEAIKKLIKKGADVNIRTSANGWGALHYAVRNGNAEAVQLLLAAGADPNYLGTMEGQTNSVVSLRPLVLAQSALDLVKLVPPDSMEDTLRKSGLDDPALLKSMTDPTAVDRYKKVVAVLAKVTKNS
jgi:ankyrin repeat protein